MIYVVKTQKDCTSPAPSAQAIEDPVALSIISTPVIKHVALLTGPQLLSDIIPTTPV